MISLRSKLAGRIGADRGFTLVELLVVVAVIGLLALIAIPTFLSQTDKAKDADAQSSVKNVTETVATLKDINTGNFSNYADGPALVAALPAAENAYTYVDGDGALQSSTGPKNVAVEKVNDNTINLQAKSSSGTYYCERVVAGGVDVKGKDAADAGGATACAGGW